MALQSPIRSSRTAFSEFDTTTSRRPYLTFKIGRGSVHVLHRLVVKIWSNDQGFISPQNSSSTDLFAGSETWFAFGLAQETVEPAEPSVDYLVGFQRNLRASSIIQCHINEWIIGLPIEDDDDDVSEVQRWLESLTLTENTKIGIFPLARKNAWVNTVWKMEVDIYYCEQTRCTHEMEWISHSVSAYDDNARVYHRQTQRLSCTTWIPNSNDVSIIVQSAINDFQKNHPSRTNSGTFWRSLAVQMQRQRSPEANDAFIKALSFEIRSVPRVHDHDSQYFTPGANIDPQDSDLAEAIKTLQLGSQESSQSQATEFDVDRAMKVDALASCLLQRFYSTGSATAINQAISLWTTGVKTTPRTSQLYVRQLECLGECFSERAQVFDSKEDLERAVQLTDEAIKGMSLDHPDRADHMTNLANRLNLLSGKSMSKSDQDRAVQAAEEAVLLTPVGNPLRSIRMELHGVTLYDRFARTGSVEDLHCALGVLDMALDAANGSPVAFGTIGVIGRCLGALYDQTGLLDDLNKSIEYLMTSATRLSEKHPHLFHRINDVGCALSKRHEHTGSMDDIDQSIDIFQKAISKIPGTSSLRLVLMTNISVSLALRYNRTASPDDLQRAIDMTEDALQATLPERESYTTCATNLGAFLSKKYENYRSLNDIDRATKLFRTVVEILPESHPRRPLEMNNLASGLRDRFGNTRSQSDLDEAIEILTRATKIIPETHYERAMVFTNLVRCYSERGEAALDDVMHCALEGWKSRSSPTSHRLAMGCMAASILNDKKRYEESWQIMESAIGLLPSMSPRALKSSDQQHMLQRVPGVASLAASIALEVGKSPVDAIRVLESGRGVMAGLLLETRVELENLKQGHSSLADEFITLRENLDPPSSFRYSQLGNQGARPWGKQAKQGQQLEARFKELIAEIRTKSGFEDFLLPPKEEELLAAASSGPIIVLNATLWRCDAIIINSDGVELLPLRHFRLSNDRGEIRVNRNSLQDIWYAIAHPVLKHLGFLESPKDGKLPHVWWILAGSLSRLPIHAAGYHNENSSENVMDCVISSYSTSINALLQSRRTSARKISHNTSHKVCLVSMSTTPSQGDFEPSNLQFAEQEIQTLDTLLLPTVPTTLLSKPDKDVVIHHIENCTAFHFAGHGVTNPVDPSKSSLLLNDWVQSPLTVEDLTSLKLHEKPTWLAYLSACSTGDNRAERLQDESIHLVSACQLAGFPHVIGSLWKIDDECSAKAAAEVYRTILQHGWTDESVALGVHNAARLLRKETTGETWSSRAVCAKSGNSDVLKREEQVAGENKTDLKESRGTLGHATRPEGDPSKWAAYIHVGP